MKKLMLMPMILLVVSCATMDFNGQAALAMQTVTEVRAQGEMLLDADKIQADDAQNIQNLADNVRAGVDIARTVHATDPAAGDKRLQAATLSLKGLRAYLLEKQK